MPAFGLVASPLPEPAAAPANEAPLPPPVKPAAVTMHPGERLPPPRALRTRAAWWPRFWPWIPVAAKFAVGLAVASAAVAWQEHRSDASPANSGTGLGQAGDQAPIARLKGHRGTINAVGFTGDGRNIVSAAADGTLKVWSTATRTLTRTLAFDNGPATAMGLDGRRAVTGHKDGTVAIWDLDSGNKIAAFKRNDASIWSVTFAGDPGRVAAAAQDWATTVWDAGSPEAPASVLEGHESAAQAVAFSAIAGTLATGSADKTIRLSKAGGGNLIRIYRGHAEGVSALAFTPDGLKLASTGQDGEIRIWSTRAPRLHYTLHGHQGRVTALAFAPDGETLVSVSDDGSVRLWNVKLGRALRTIKNHTGELKALGLSPDGRQIAAAGVDGIVRLYNAVVPKPAI